MLRESTIRVFGDPRFTFATGRNYAFSKACTDTRNDDICRNVSDELWKLTVVFEYCEAKETYSRI